MTTRRLLPSADLYHRFDLRLPASPGAEVLTIHDTAWLHFDDEGRPPPNAAKLVRQAAAVIAPSQFAATEVEHAFDVPCRVIYNGVGAHFYESRPLSATELADLEITRPFLLCSGGSTERKNVADLVAAWSSLDIDTHQLVITGGKPPAVARGLVHVGHLPGPTYRSLLSAAHGVVVPSRYEGFGLPAIEAMAAGQPVVAAAAGSLPEICANAALLVSVDRGGLARGLRTLLYDAELRRCLVARGQARARIFTWERAAEEHTFLYRKILARAR